MKCRAGTEQTIVGDATRTNNSLSDRGNGNLTGVEASAVTQIQRRNLGRDSEKENSHHTNDSYSHTDCRKPFNQSVKAQKATGALSDPRLLSLPAPPSARRVKNPAGALQVGSLGRRLMFVYILYIYLKVFWSSETGRDIRERRERFIPLHLVSIGGETGCESSGVRSRSVWRRWCLLQDPWVYMHTSLRLFRSDADGFLRAGGVAFRRFSGVPEPFRTRPGSGRTANREHPGFREFRNQSLKTSLGGRVMMLNMTWSL